MGRQLRKITGYENGAPSCLFNGGEGGAKEGVGLHIGTAGSEDDGLFSGSEKLLELRGKGLLGGEIFQRESVLVVRCRPVGLRCCKPIGKQEERSIWRVKPLSKDTARGRHSDFSAGFFEPGLCFLIGGIWP